MVEGRPFRTAAIAGSSALVGAGAGAGWVAIAVDLAGKLSGDAQVIALQFLGLVIVIAEVGLIVIVWQTIRTSLPGPRNERDMSLPSAKSAQTEARGQTPVESARAPRVPPAD